MTDSQSKILLIEDDAGIALGLKDALTFEGFLVEHAATGKDGIEAAAIFDPDCVILDIMLPDLSGYQVCERIRNQKLLMPVLMLTARGQEADKLRGFHVGADDYLTKPFSLAELIVRVQALLRRAQRVHKPDAKPFRVGTADIEPRTQTMTQNGESTQLSHHEVELLKLLHERHPEPVTREEIGERLWGTEPSPSSRSIDNLIVKLRKKIEPDPENPRHILTIYGMGYKLVP